MSRFSAVTTECWANGVVGSKGEGGGGVRWWAELREATKTMELGGWQNYEEGCGLSRYEWGVRGGDKHGERSSAAKVGKAAFRYCLCIRCTTLTLLRARPGQWVLKTATCRAVASLLRNWIFESFPEFPFTSVLVTSRERWLAERREATEAFAFGGRRSYEEGVAFPLWLGSVWANDTVGSKGEGSSGVQWVAELREATEAVALGGW